MADAQSVVELVFKGVDQTAEATQSALRNVQDFSSDIQKLTSPIADATEKAFKLEGALLVATGALLGYSTKVAGEFDAAFREIATLTGTASDNLGDFRQEILDYAATSTQPLDSVTNAIYNAISAGVDYVDSVDFIRDAEQLAVAGKADLTEATEILVSTLNAFGREVKDAGDFADILFKAVEDGQTTLPELATQLGRVAGLAAPAGVEMDELAAAVSTLTSSGVDTGQAVSSLRGIISNIIKPTALAGDAAADLGIGFDASALAADGLSGLLPILAGALDGNVGKAADLFGSVEALNGILLLTSKDGLAKFQSSMENQEGRTGAVARAYDDMARSIGLSNQKVTNALKVLFVEIGDPLLDAYGGVAEAIAAVFIAITENIAGTGLEDVLDYVKDVLLEAEGFFQQVADNIPQALEQADFSGFIRNIDAIRDGVEKLLGGIDLSTPEGLADAMTAVADAFGLLGEFAGGAIGNFEIIVTTAFKAFDAFSKLNPDLASSAGAFAGMVTIFDKLLPALDTLLLLLIVKQTKGLVGGAAAAALSVAALGKAIGTAGLALGAGASIWKISELVGILWDWRNAVKDAKEEEVTVFGDADAELQEVADRLGIVLDSYQDLWDLVNDGKIVFDETTNQLELATDRQAGTVEVVEDAFDRLWDVVASGGQAFDTVEQALDHAVDGQQVFFDEATKKWLVLGDTVSGFGDLFTDGIFDSAELRIERLGQKVEDNGKTWEYARDESGRFFLKLIDDSGVAEDASEGWIKTIVDGVPTFAQVGDAASKGFGEAEKAAEDATRKSEDYLVKMEKIASNERIKLIEAKVALDIAEVEANADIVQATFDSITSTIGESYDLLGDLFGLLGDVDRFTELKIESQIKKENERLDKQFELQKKVTEAEIEYTRAKTDQLYRGESLIQIDGAGLQPHLEAFMWEILRTIQVRVNQDGLEMLLGTPA